MNLKSIRSDISLRSPGERRSHLQYVCLLLALILLPECLLAAPATDEYKFKAVLIYKLTKFVEWPDSIPGRNGGSFDICLLGDDVFGSNLDILEGRMAAGQPVRVRRFSQSVSVDSHCHILFISSSKQAFLNSILNKLRDQPILTLGDSEGFAEQGGMIQFVRDNNRFGFKINLESAKRSGLLIAAPLLDLSTVVRAATGDAAQ